MKINRLTLLVATAALSAGCSSRAPEPFGACPAPEQVEWQKMEMNMFCHFGPNTFTNVEWGNGRENPDVFAPDSLDCRQWARVARAGGFKGIILTAKHHDGFCLWPNPQSTHTVAQSSWRDGKGDVVKELSDACSEEGIKFGVYVSPWDRNHPDYGSDAYNDVFVKTLESILGDYGPVYEQWFDGANGEGPSGKRQTYDWPRFNGTVARLQPGAVIFSDVGPGCRWVGNERGYAGETNWSTIAAEGFEPGAKAPAKEFLNGGQKGAPQWIPAETDVSIRPGWFFRESENERVKSVPELLRIWYESVGRNSLLLLNIPPDTHGRIHPIDSSRVAGLKAVLDDIFSDDKASGSIVKASGPNGGKASRRGFRPSAVTDSDYDSYWAAKEGCTMPQISLRLPSRRTFNRVMLQEYIPLGQRVESFEVDVKEPDGTWRTIACETTIGYKRVVLTETVTTSEVRVRITGALAPPVISRIGLFQDNYEKPWTGLWRELAKGPSKDRKYAVTNLSADFLREEPDYTAELGDQALMGTVVEVLDTSGSWIKVRTREPYTAWTNFLGLTPMDSEELAAYIAAPKYICTALESKVFSTPSALGEPVSDLVAGCLLRKGSPSAAPGFLGVVLPDGRKGYVRAEDLEDFGEWSARTGKMSDGERAETIVRAATSLVGVPYLWGGSSPKGVDCSGFTGCAYREAGILLPRNASQQAVLGVEVPKESLRKGDLIFWGTPAEGETPERVSHVGIYIGGRRFLHASQALVRYSSLDPSAPDFYSREPLHFRRILGHYRDVDGVSFFASNPWYFPQK